MSGPFWWLSARVLTANDPNIEAWNAADEITADPTADLLVFALPEDATVCVLGWPDRIGEALPRRGDLDVLVVDALGEGSGFVRRLLHADMDVVDVPMAGLGAAVADADLVLLEASAIGPDGFVGVAGSRAARPPWRNTTRRPSGSSSGVGRAMPRRMWDVLVSRLDTHGDPWDLDDEVVPLDLVDLVAGPSATCRSRTRRSRSTARSPPSCSSPSTAVGRGVELGHVSEPA